MYKVKRILFPDITMLYFSVVQASKDQETLENTFFFFASVNVIGELNMIDPL